MNRRDEIVAAATGLLERSGPEGLTMRAIADVVGIKAASIYKHIESKDELVVLLIAEGLTSQAEAFEKSLVGAEDPIIAIASAYRGWANDHPHLYEVMNSGPMPREDLPDDVEGRSIAPVLAAFNGNRELARAAWAFAHGMVTLEIADRFPPGADLDTTWRLGISSIAATAPNKKGPST